MSLDRKTGIFVPPEAAKEDQSEFLTGEPLADRKPGDIDFYIVRENTEGEYSNAGGRMFEGSEREMALQETIMTRHGVDRVLKFAF